jgi:hypothetical protein
MSARKESKYQALFFLLNISFLGQYLPMANAMDNHNFLMSCRQIQGDIQNEGEICAVLFAPAR